MNDLENLNETVSEENTVENELEKEFPVLEEPSEEKQQEETPKNEELTDNVLSEKIISELTSTRKNYAELQEKHQALLKQVNDLLFNGGVISSDDRKSSTDISNFSQKANKQAEGVPTILSLEGFESELF